MLFTNTAAAAILVLSSFGLAANHGTAGNRNHNRALNNKRAAASPLFDIHGRQLPGSVQMRKRTTGACKAKSSSSSPVATTTTAATVATSKASSYSSSPSSSVVSTSTAQIVQAAAATTTSNAAASSSSSVKVSSTLSSSVKASSTASSAVASATSTSTYSAWIPNGNKAGISAGDTYDIMSPYIGWWYDWSANPSGHTGTPIAVNMLWGGGTVDATDASRLAAFKALTYTPKFVFGFEEPDCAAGSGSSGLSEITGALLWNQLVGPLKAKGSVLGSPSMCKQLDETWLTPFKNLIEVDWDFTSVHINKNSMAGVKADLDYFYNKYGKPMMVNEFACVDDSSSFVPCTDQTAINTFIADIVDIFEADSRVIGYAMSNGDGLGTVWPAWSNGALTESGQAYLTAVKKYHS
ncbi:Uncharacterised protein family, glycosyl hydrolase catalytic domain [Phaffia rhodozyma]|uniref:Uncharacterized protein family, glycosyl hydrolase catalytic domain n=1 Tax=Phaffia rhodozyma TaxID=264483 RepID=A0A0F7SN85_PHARH|nr:Uncharacterised protein family, glycosyl hydrolase catalytic domain [Phaffia rhodozyma]